MTEPEFRRLKRRCKISSEEEAEFLGFVAKTLLLFRLSVADVEEIIREFKDEILAIARSDEKSSRAKHLIVGGQRFVAISGDQVMYDLDTGERTTEVHPALWSISMAVNISAMTSHPQQIENPNNEPAAL